MESSSYRETIKGEDIQKLSCSDKLQSLKGTGLRRSEGGGEAGGKGRWGRRNSLPGIKRALFSCS